MLDSSTHCVSLFHPEISILSVDMSLNFHVSCSLLLSSLSDFLLVSSSVFSSLSPHLLFCCCHFPLPPLPVSFFSVWYFVSLSVFSLLLHVILSHNIPSVSLPFFFVFLLSLWTRPGYFLCLKPWRWIIQQTDPWQHSCCLGVVCCSFLWFHFSSLSASGLVRVSVFFEQYLVFA